MPLKLQPMIGWCTLLNMYIYQSVCWPCEVLCSFLVLFSSIFRRQLSAFHVRSLFVIIWLLIVKGCPVSSLLWSGLDGLVWIRFFYLTFYSTSHICCMCVCVVVWLSPQSLGCGFDRRPWKVKELTITPRHHFVWRQYFEAAFCCFLLPGFLLLICWADSSKIEAA